MYYKELSDDLAREVDENIADICADTVAVQEGRISLRTWRISLIASAGLVQDLVERIGQIS